MKANKEMKEKKKIERNIPPKQPLKNINKFKSFNNNIQSFAKNQPARVTNPLEGLFDLCKTLSCK